MPDKTIFFWSADRGGCGFYRCEEPARVLKALGHNAVAKMQMPERMLAEADVIVGQRVCLPAPSRTWQKLAEQGRAKLVYEIDDDLLDVDPLNRAAFVLFRRPEVREAIQRNITVADEVTVTTDRLAEVVSRWNPNVRVIPNYLPASMLEIDRRIAKQATIGWYGSSSHLSDFVEAGPQLARYLRRNPEVFFHSMGGHFDWHQRVASYQLKVSSWFDSMTALWKAMDFWVGVAALRPSSFNRAKSDLKVKEMAALGIPSVVDDFGPYELARQQGAPVLPVRRPHEWVRHIETLMDDEAARSELGASAKAWARTQVIDDRAKEWEALLP